MKHIIIGTAGHIDHGKTSLIKAITGRSTDTLKEEKDRGISINLGFTYFDLPSSRRAGIIDVPGHEKFIKNMLAGISGIDLVLMVIAADEGIMPQTEEHFQILKLLGVKKGIIVLTKIDMVDKEWIDMVKTDIKEKMKGTFMENSPICEVSSKTKQGIKELVNIIDTATEDIETKNIGEHFRLPVDRVFTISGFGTVITGTIIGGSVKEGDLVEIYPSQVASKVRGIQVHENPVKCAEAGQRCALNLASIKTSELKRGFVVASPGYMSSSLIIDCKLFYLDGTNKPLKNRQRVRLYHGTSEILCRIILLGKEELQPGEEAYVQIRLEEPITAQRNDRFVIRSYSPMNTIGGGVIIEPVSKKVKGINKEYIEELKIKEKGEVKDIIEKAVEKLSDVFPDKDQILKAIGKNEPNIDDKLEDLVINNIIIKIFGKDMEKPIYIHANYYKYIEEKLTNTLNDFHKTNPLKSGMSKEEIKTKLFNKALKQKTYDELINILQSGGVIKLKGNSLCIRDFIIVLDNNHIKVKKKILSLYKDSKFNPPKFEELLNQEKDKKTFKMVYALLIDEGELIKLSEDSVLHRENYIFAKEQIINLIREKGSITTPMWREFLDTNRKHAVAILEHFDNIKLTKRIEDKRILL